MVDEQSEYLSFLLRLWRVSDSGCPVWRASLQDTLTGDRVSFANLEDLVVFLRCRMEKGLDAGADATESKG